MVFEKDTTYIAILNLIDKITEEIDNKKLSLVFLLLPETVTISFK